MNIVKILLISFLSISFAPKLLSQADCPEMKVETTIKHTSGGLANGEVTLELDKKDQYTIFLFGPDENRLELKEGKIAGLKKGEYNIFVQDKKGCAKRISIKIN